MFLNRVLTIFVVTVFATTNASVVLSGITDSNSALIVTGCFGLLSTAGLAVLFYTYWMMGKLRDQEVDNYGQLVSSLNKQLAAAEARLRERDEK